MVYDACVCAWAAHLGEGVWLTFTERNAHAWGDGRTSLEASVICLTGQKAKWRGTQEVDHS